MKKCLFHGLPNSSAPRRTRVNEITYKVSWLAVLSNFHASEYKLAGMTTSRSALGLLHCWVSLVFGALQKIGRHGLYARGILVYSERGKTPPPKVAAIVLWKTSDNKAQGCSTFHTQCRNAICRLYPNLDKPRLSRNK